MKKKTKSSPSKKTATSTQKKAARPSKRAKAAQKVKSAASHLKKTTKKLVDDVFLKIVGMRVLERAKEMTRKIKKEKKPASKGRKS